MKRVLLIGVVLAGLLAGTAQAKAPSEGWGAAELHAAEQYWGTDSPPNCATEEIRWEVAPGYNGERGDAATVPTEPGSACVMWLVPDISVYDGCLIFVHEYGHWMGYAWGTDPTSITYDGATVGGSATGIPWEPGMIGVCRRLAKSR